MNNALKIDDELSIFRKLDEPDAFSREDESEDSEFYGTDRFIQHLDATALKTVENVVGQLTIESDKDALDLMASFDSHIPEGTALSRVVGLGMNEKELAANTALTERLLQDLNKDPALPLDDESFDVALNTVSVDYLTDPFKVFEEVGRVLRPGGLFLVVFSNRWFPQKVVKVWAEASDDERIDLLIEFFRRAGVFEEPEVFISMGKPRPKDDKFAPLGVPSDPIYAVYAQKKGGDRSKRRPIAADDIPPKLDPVELKRRKKEIKHTMSCPHCGEKLKKWRVPDDPFLEWNVDYMYICFNDACPYTVRGWYNMHRQGNTGVTYRLMYNPEADSTIAVPVHSLTAMREGIED